MLRAGPPSFVEEGPLATPDEGARFSLGEVIVGVLLLIPLCRLSPALNCASQEDTGFICPFRVPSIVPGAGIK